MSKTRPAGVLANEIIRIFDHRNPQPLQGIPRDESSRQQIGVMLDDLAHVGDVDRMRRLARDFALWLGDEVEKMIDQSLARRRRWNAPDEIRELAELFQLSETERDTLGIRQIRPVHPDGSAFDDQQESVDTLQESAAAQGLVATHGQDAIQEIMAESFGRWSV